MATNMNSFFGSEKKDCPKGKLYIYLTIAIAVVSLLPLMLPRMELWDFVQMELGFTTQDDYYFLLLKNWYYARYLITLAINEVSLLFGVPAKIIFNGLSILGLVGLAREVFVFLNQRYGFSKTSSYVGAWAILTFPVWHTLASGAMLFYILFLWSFMVSVNLWWKKRYFLAIPFFFFSLRYFSIFSLAVGFACSEFCLRVTRENFKNLIAKTIGFCLVLLAGFLLLESLTNIHQSGDYNTFKPRLLSFATYGVLALVTGIGTFFYSRKLEKSESEKLIRFALSFLAIAFFSGLAYWTVGRPLRFFAFGSFTARHTYLTCIPFALIACLVAERLQLVQNKKIYVSVISFLIVLLLVLQHQGHSHKAAALVFKEMLTQTFKEAGEPPSGYVSIDVEGAKPPRHIHSYEINMSLYRAFGRGAWMANGYWAKRGASYDRKMLEEKYSAVPPDMLKRNIAGDVTGDAYSKYKFTVSAYHQEGRFWYWWYYLNSDYSAFNPRLELLELEE